MCIVQYILYCIELSDKQLDLQGGANSRQNRNCIAKSWQIYIYLQEPLGKSEQAVRQREGKYFQKISQKNTLNAAYILV